MKCQLLISLQNADELLAIGEFSIPWIDLKNPSAGSLGCPSLKTIQRFLETAKAQQEMVGQTISLAIGELSEKAWESLGSVLGEFDFIKVALGQSLPDLVWFDHLRELTERTVPSHRLVVTHYADYQVVSAINWEETLAAAARLRLPYVLIDTCLKRQGRLWDWYPPKRIESLVAEAQREGVALALAGSLHLNELRLARQLGASVVGIRGAVCQDGSRVGPLCRVKLEEALKQFQPNPENLKV